MDFLETDRGIECWVTREEAPFDDVVLGHIKRNDEDFYVFYPVAGAEINCGHMKRLLREIGPMNFSEPVK